MSRLFISHSSANNAEAVAIRDWLVREGWDEVFLDLDPARGIAAGERWERALNEAASRCEAVLFLVSRAWLDSRWCLKEFNLARRLNKRLFGVLIEAIPLADLPEDLSGTWQVVDLASGQDHAMFRVALPRTQEEAHVTFSREGLARLRGGLARAGLDPRFFDWPPERRPRAAALSRSEAARGRRRRHLLRPRRADRRGARPAAWLARGAAPRLLVILGASGCGQVVIPARRVAPTSRARRSQLPATAVIRPEHAAIERRAGFVRGARSGTCRAGLTQPRADIREAIAGGARDCTAAACSRLVDKAFARHAGRGGRRTSSPRS